MWSARRGNVRDPVVRGSKAVTVGARVLERGWVELPRWGFDGLRVRWPGRCYRSVVQGTGTVDVIVVKGSVAHQ